MSMGLILELAESVDEQALKKQARTAVMTLIYVIPWKFEAVKAGDHTFYQAINPDDKLEIISVSIYNKYFHANRASRKVVGVIYSYLGKHKGSMFPNELASEPEKQQLVSKIDRALAEKFIFEPDVHYGLPLQPKHKRMPADLQHRIINYTFYILSEAKHV